MLCRLHFRPHRLTKLNTMSRSSLQIKLVFAPVTFPRKTNSDARPMSRNPHTSQSNFNNTKKSEENLSIIYVLITLLFCELNRRRGYIMNVSDPTQPRSPGLGWPLSSSAFPT